MANKGITTKLPAPSPVTYFGGKVTRQQLMRWGPIAVVVVLLLMVWAVWALLPEARASGFARNAMNLLWYTAVQNELKIAPEQQQQQELRKLYEAHQQAMSSIDRRNPSAADEKKEIRLFRAEEEAVAKILDPGQLARLKQIYYQQRGSRAWFDEEVAQALKLTRQQKEELVAIQQAYQTNQRELFKGGNRDPAQKQDDAQRQARMQQAEEMRQAHNKQLQDILSPEQQATWQEMLGDPFKDLALLQRGPGGGGPGGGQGRRNRGPGG